MKRYLNFRPILYFAISLILGILSAYLYFSKAFIILSILIVLFLICLILFLIMARGKIKSKLIYLLVFVLFSIIGTCSCTLSIIDYDRADLGKVNLTVNGRITEVYQTESSKAYFLSEVKFSGIKNVKSNYKLCVYVYGATDYDVGDIISFYATVNDLGVVYEGKINTQNIASKYKYNCTVYSDKITLLGNNTTIFEKVNLGIRKALQEGLDSREFSVAYALMCGNSEYMDEELIFSFRQAGVAHIFAVSGLHIGFMATSISFLLRKFKINKIISAIITILLLIFYSGVCGFSISSLRAVIMYSVFILSSNFGGRYDSLSSLSFSALIILLISPMQLFCVGFQLSFAVVLGIILLSKRISKVFGFLPKKLANSIGMVLSSQIASIPILLDCFGRVSFISIIINLIFLPIVSVIFTLLFIMVFASMITGLGYYVLFPMNYILKVINALFVKINYGFLAVNGFVFGFLSIVYYLIIFIISGKINLSKLVTKIFSFILILILITGIPINMRVKDFKNSIYVIGSDSICATAFSGKDENLLVVNSYSAVYSLGRLRSLKERLNTTKIDKVIMATGGEEVKLQEFVSRMLCVWDIEEVFYFKEIGYTESCVLQMSFPQTEFFSVDINEKVVGEQFDFRFALEGYAAEVSCEEESAVTFAKFGKDNSNYNSENFNANIIIASDYLEQIYYYQNPKDYVSYLYNGFYIDAEKEGTRILYFKN